MILFLQDLPEKQPALLSLVFAGGFALLCLLLLLSFIRQRRRRAALAAIAGTDLPKEVQARLGATSTNRGLYFLRVFFVLAAIGVFGTHVYWARYAEERNERFQELSYKDLRNRRLSESTLRGWILDRTGELDRAFAFYRRTPTGEIVRDYKDEIALSHLLGSERGDPGLERALFGVQSSAVPEAFDVVREQRLSQQANQDVRLTIHGDLQRTAVELLKNRHGAIVAINPQTGEVLALYSNPSYNLKEARDEATWIRLDADKRDSPLVNRALSSYYVPGSTFKTVTMIASYMHGVQDQKFLCSGNGYYAQPGARVIFDDQGPAEVHGMIGNDIAYQVSCNQYYAQMAVKLGPERLRQTAEALGIGAYDSPEEALAGRKLPAIWNTSSPAIARALAPRESTIVTNGRIRPYDIALEGFGQGYAGQMTPFQMALAAAAVANIEGKLMKPKIEFDLPPQVYRQVVSPAQAADMRRIMGLVTGGPQGTARGVFAPIQQAGIITGGKTGTAQKEVPVYDPRTGEPVTETRYERDRRGQIIRQYQAVKINPEPRIDGWFLLIAPLDRPQLAMAVVIEGGGYGSRSAAPVAAAMTLKAKELGLLGNIPQPTAQPTPSQRRSGAERVARRQ